LEPILGVKSMKIEEHEYAVRAWLCRLQDYMPCPHGGKCPGCEHASSEKEREKYSDHM